MKNITSVTHTTLSIGAAHYASKNNHKATVVLGKCDEGTSIVIQATNVSRRSRFVKCGYVRFGARKEVWVETRELPVCPLSLTCDTGETLDERLCREITNRMTDAANASANAKIAA